MICGDGYIGERPPTMCPFCGAHSNWIRESELVKVTFDVSLNPAERANIETALQLEAGNAAFYFCAADKTDDPQGKILFKALGKVEAEHASIWKKILKLEKVPQGSDACHASNKENLEEAHQREDHAIKFYSQALAQAVDGRVKQIFSALIEVETDHLRLHEQYLAKA